MNSRTYISDALHHLPPLDQFEDYLNKELDTLIDCVFPAKHTASYNDEGLESLSPLPPSLPPPDLPSPGYERMRKLFEAGRQGMQKLHRFGEGTPLEPEEEEGLEAIILTMTRPAIIIQNGSFPRPPSEWLVLERVRPGIERTLQSVGRIELRGHPTHDWCGTGFLVAEDVIMTNRHVAVYFCQSVSEEWTFHPGVTASIDYLKEVYNTDSFTFAITDVIGIYDGIDLALLGVAPLSSRRHAPPHPLTLASHPQHISNNSLIYVVGYPRWDGYSDNETIIYNIFGSPELHGFKRLQPGKVLGIHEDNYLLTHDCSTLGGNSGSCIVDIQTNTVIGLHKSGRPRQVNSGIPLWTLCSDPLMRRAGVWFD
jgi:glutamyl endopeptidase